MVNVLYKTFQTIYIAVMKKIWRYNHFWRFRERTLKNSRGPRFSTITLRKINIFDQYKDFHTLMKENPNPLGVKSSIGNACTNRPEVERGPSKINKIRFSPHEYWKLFTWWKKFHYPSAQNLPPWPSGRLFKC